jgi:hypothetical protein
LATSTDCGPATHRAALRCDRAGRRDPRRRSHEILRFSNSAFMLAHLARPLRCKNGGTGSVKPVTMMRRPDRRTRTIDSFRLSVTGFRAKSKPTISLTFTLCVRSRFRTTHWESQNHTPSRADRSASQSPAAEQSHPAGSTGVSAVRPRARNPRSTRARAFEVRCGQEQNPTRLL